MVQGLGFWGVSFTVKGFGVLGLQGLEFATLNALNLKPPVFELLGGLDAGHGKL